ncbi:MAG: hypothetical protein WC205_04315 [Opitutaceae bacterium]|jgi:hypothetical protein
MSTDISMYSDEDLARIAGEPVAPAVEPGVQVAAPVLESEAPDISSVSDADLERIAAGGVEALAPDLSAMSDADLYRAAGVNPLDDFDAYNAFEQEKKDKGYDPNDPGIAKRMWDGVSGFFGGIRAAGTEVLRLQGEKWMGGGPADPNQERLKTAARQEEALLVQGAGKALGNYNVLGQGANTLKNKALVNFAKLFTDDPEMEAKLEKVSRGMSWQFEREARDTQQFTDNFNKNIAVIMPESFAAIAASDVDNKAAGGVADLIDPANYVPVAQAVGWTTRVPLKGVVSAAERAVREAAFDVAKSTAQREAATLAMKPGLVGAEREALRKGILDAGKASREAGERLAANRAAYASTLKAQEEELVRLRMAVPGAQVGAARAVQAVGTALDRAGAVAEAVAGVPDALARKIAPGNEAAQAAVGDAVQNGVRNVTGLFGAVPAASGVAGMGLRRAGQDLRIIGDILTQAEGQLPFFRRVARDTGGPTSWLASVIDETRLAPLITATGRTAAQGVRGAPLQGAIGFVGSGGDTEAILPAAAGGAFIGMAGAGMGQWRRYAQPDIVRQKQMADVGRYRQAIAGQGEQAVKFFDALPSRDRVALSTFQLAHPDLMIRYARLGKGRASFYTTGGEGGPVAMINLDSRDPIRAVASHEVAHHIEKHGLFPAIRRELLGDEAAGSPGLYTLLDKQGKPVLDADGRFQTTPEWDGFKKQYQTRLDAEGDMVGQAFGKLDNDAIAREVFAEHAADYLLGGDPVTGESNIGRAMRAPSDRVLRSLAQSWVGESFPFMQRLVGKTGAVMDPGGRIVGSRLFSDAQLVRSPALRRMADQYHRALAQRGRAMPLDEGEGGAVVYQASELRANPQILQKLFDGSGEVARGPDGKPIINADGTPRFLTNKEQAQANKALTDKIWEWYQANPAQRGGLRIEKLPEGKKLVDHVVGPLPPALLESLAKDKNFNAVQLANLGLISDSLAKQPGDLISMFYQPATKGGRDTRYRSLKGDWRTEAPYAIAVSQEGNLYIRTTSKEKLVANAEALFRRGGGQLWGDNVAAFMGDVDTYLANHAAGKPGSEGIGEAKRDVINELFGVSNKNNAGVNPLFDTAPRRSPIVFRSRRIDRMNRVAPVEGERFNVDYYKVRDNKRPEAPLDDGAGGSQKTPMDSPETPPATASLTPAQKAWAEVKPGARFDEVKKHIPKDPVKMAAMDFEGLSSDQAMQKIRDFLLQEPVVTAFDGKRILVANPQGSGDGLLNRAEHLAGRRKQSMGSGTRDFTLDKARLVASIPETLRSGSLKVDQGREHLYFKKYKDGLLHMVVVDPHGFVSDHGAVDASLVTQYTPEAKKRFEGARVLTRR